MDIVHRFSYETNGKTTSTTFCRLLLNFGVAGTAQLTYPTKKIAPPTTHQPHHHGKVNERRKTKNKNETETETRKV